MYISKVVNKSTSQNLPPSTTLNQDGSSDIEIYSIV